MPNLINELYSLSNMLGAHNVSGIVHACMALGGTIVLGQLFYPGKPVRRI